MCSLASLLEGVFDCSLSIAFRTVCWRRQVEFGCSLVGGVVRESMGISRQCSSSPTAIHSIIFNALHLSQGLMTGRFFLVCQSSWAGDLRSGLLRHITHPADRAVAEVNTDVWLRLNLVGLFTSWWSLDVRRATEQRNGEGLYTPRRPNSAWRPVISTHPALGPRLASSTWDSCMGE